MKLNALLDDILKKGIFSKTTAHIYVIEAQKHSFLHAHILKMLADEDKPRTTDNFDLIVSAEISNLDKKYSKGYPKPFQSVFCEMKMGIQLDNRWVVPHNLYLCKKYNCHINVEICFSIQAVKYLFKYVYKGHDRKTVANSNQYLQLTEDEIENHALCLLNDILTQQRKSLKDFPNTPIPTAVNEIENFLIAKELDYNQEILTEFLLKLGEGCIPKILPNKLQTRSQDAAYLLERRILASRNDEVDKLNLEVLEQFPDAETTYY
ncbi:12428_t:CDS:2, partial [Racocetra persica]